jgi:hypothetical protein
VVGLDEDFKYYFDYLAKNHEKVKGKFDRKAHVRTLQKGDIVLKWD